MATKLDSSKDIYRGELMLFIGDEPIAFASSCGLDVSTEEIDISNNHKDIYKMKTSSK